jgi:hypothetical protein
MTGVMRGVRFLATYSMCLLAGWAGASVALGVEGVVALHGEPFGVGRVVVTPADAGGAIDPSLFHIEEKDGRVYYPAVAVEKPRIGGLIREILGAPEARPLSATVYFLFRGTEPLDVTIRTPRGLRVEFRPAAGGAEAGEKLLSAWWNAFHTNAEKSREASAYPPQAMTFLESTLARRLSIRMDIPSDPQTAKGGISEALNLLLGVEQMRDVLMRRSLAGADALDEGQRVPLPAAIEWPQREYVVAANVEVEPLATRVPRECLYVRFGNFANQTWFNRLRKEYGGDILEMLIARGVDNDLQDRLESQLAVTQEKTDELFGPTVVNDIGLIGFDTFTRDGSSMGVLVQAKNSLVYSTSMAARRRNALAREKGRGATLETVKIRDREVSFLSTPDNRLRSYHAADGDFHLVTNSRRLVERFFDCRDNGETLAATAEFQHARELAPLSPQETLFAYLSSHFFQNLASPAYQIETRRRLQSLADIDSLRLARRMAAREGRPLRDAEDLIAVKILPDGFGRRPDGSGLIETEDDAIDSMRGARGFFLPVADVEVKDVTVAEAQRYQQLQEFLVTKWREMDPISVSIKRFQGQEPNRERLVVDAQLHSFRDDKYGWLFSIVGPPNHQKLIFPEDDPIQVQAFVQGGLLDSTIRPHHLFVGVPNDVATGGELPKDLLDWWRLIRATPGYLGAWPKSGFVDLLPLGLGGTPPDASGYSRLPLGLWRREGDGFSVVSFYPEALTRVTPQLAVAESEDAAQVRVKIQDLNQSKLRDFARGWAYKRAAQVSQGNASLLNLLEQHYGVSSADALAESEKLVDGKLVCPLGGEYQVVKLRDGGHWWASTAQQPAGASPPQDFKAPILQWFRGLEASLIKSDDRLLIHGYLDIERQPGFDAGGIKLPSFDLLGWGKKDPKPGEDPKPPTKLFPDSSSAPGKQAPPGKRPPRRPF